MKTSAINTPEKGKGPLSNMKSKSCQWTSQLELRFLVISQLKGNIKMWSSTLNSQWFRNEICTYCSFKWQFLSLFSQENQPTIQEPLQACKSPATNCCASRILLMFGNEKQTISFSQLSGVLTKSTAKNRLTEIRYLTKKTGLFTKLPIFQEKKYFQYFQLSTKKI